MGGLKVHPEEIETVLNRHIAVRQSRVKARKSPIIGAIVIADIVLREQSSDAQIVKDDIWRFAERRFLHTQDSGRSQHCFLRSR